MSNVSSRSEPSRPLSLNLRINEACDRFEQAWQAGQRPQVEDYLGAAPERGRPALLRELLSLELAYRRQSGETLVLEDYLRRFPENAELIRAGFVAGERSMEAAASEHPTSTGPEANRPGEVDPPERLGRYRITALLGKGGFGVVYKGHDDELRRDVAIKVPHRSRVAQPEDVETYLAEARIVASLDHPHIVPVYDVGRTDDGACFVVSKFIEGQ